MRCTPALRCMLVPALLTAPLAAQEADTTRVDTTRVDSAPRPTPLPPPPPTTEQQRYLDGLRRVGRGTAQLRIGVDQASRAQSAKDTLSRRRAARRLGGFCGSARSFMTSGRAQMQPLVYQDTIQVRARQLTQRVDDIIKYTRTCETQASAASAVVSAELQKRLQAYDSALVQFRVAVGLQTPTDSTKP
jgi:hypothetical protein